MRRLGLTGGIGSGKSTVAGLFARLGAAIIDADANARAVTASGGLAIDAIRHAFGAEFIDESGALDRARMRSLVFSQPSAKQQLEAIVHPLVGLLGEQQTTEAQADGRACAVYDIPLLVESGRWRRQLDHVLVVDCLPQTQIERVVQRNGMTAEAVRAIMAAQAMRSERLAAADAVIFNEGITLEELHAQTHAMAGRFGL